MTLYQMEVKLRQKAEKQRDDLLAMLQAIVDDQVSFGDHAAQALVLKTLLADASALIKRVKK